MTLMNPASRREELVDVIVRLPRKALEDTLLSIPAGPRDLGRRRLDDAKALLMGHRRRTDYFGGIHFTDPSWFIILELYVATREQRVLAVSQICSLSGTSSTTALRLIENMEARGYLVREADPADRRRILIAMLPRMVSALEGWLDVKAAAEQIGSNAIT